MTSASGPGVGVGAASFLLPGAGQLLLGARLPGVQYLLAALLLWPLAFPLLGSAPPEARLLAAALLLALHLGAGLTALGDAQRLQGPAADPARAARAYRFWSNLVALLSVVLLADLLLRWMIDLPNWRRVFASGQQFFVGRLFSDEYRAQAWHLWGFVPAVLGLGGGWLLFQRRRGLPALASSLAGTLAAAALLWPLLFPTQIVGGLAMSLILAFLGIVFSLPLGILFGIGRLSELPVIRGLSGVYVEGLRSVPFVAVIFLFYLNLPYALGNNTQFQAVVLALVIFTSAYVAEIVRAGIGALPRGQTEAARSLGLSGSQTMLRVVLPQALQNMIPPLVGQFISLFKDTSLTSIVAVLELTGVARGIQNRLSVANFEIFLFTALLYFVVAYGLSRLAHALEKRGSLAR
ncbi:MAG: amino acid ABC transporter permease [Deinococcus sp.]